MATLNEILYQAVDGSFAIDANQRIIYWDTGCEELLGISERWVLGRPCYDVLKGCQPTSEKPFCKRDCGVAKLANGGTAPKSFMVKVNDGENQPVNLSVNILLVPSGCKNSWHIMHLLHKASYPDVFGLLENHDHRRDERSRHNRTNYDFRPKPATSRLTTREMQILELMSEGISGASIAKRLNISITTVRNHIQHIQAKLGVHSKTEAVAYAYRHHFI